MRRGDIVAVVAPGSYGKPRPAVVIQSDLFEEHPSVTILPLTSTLRNVPLFRLQIEPSETNGLHSVSEVMVDKITTIPREKVSQVFGQLTKENMVAIERSIALFLGIA